MNLCFSGVRPLGVGATLILKKRMASNRGTEKVEWENKVMGQSKRKGLNRKCTRTLDKSLSILTLTYGRKEGAGMKRLQMDNLRAMVKVKVKLIE